MRELLERTKTFLAMLNVDQSVRSGESIALYTAIDTELSRPEPDYWHVVDQHGNSIYSASFKEACMDHINDVIESSDTYSLEEAASWVVRPLFTHPARQPVLLSDDEIEKIIYSTVDCYDVTHQEIGASDGFARAVEQAVLKANGIGGVE